MVAEIPVGTMNQDRYMQAVWFIDRLDKRYRMNRGVGWVYAMRNSEFKKPLLKIGMTRNPPYERAQQLASATGVPGHFDLVYFVHAMNREMAEAQVHQKLAAHRTTGEFFEVPVSRAVEAMDEAASLYRINMDLARPKKRGGWGDDWLPQVFEHTIAECPRCGQKNKIHALAVAHRPKCGKCERSLLE